MANPLDDLRIKVRARLLHPARPLPNRCTAQGCSARPYVCTAAWQAIRPLVPSACLIEDAPADAEVYDTVSTTRTALSKAVRGEDGRIVVIVGPTDIHECKATMEFAVKLSAMAESLKADLIVVMRVGMAPHGDWAGMVSRHSLPPATCCEPRMIIPRPPPRADFRPRPRRQHQDQQGPAAGAAATGSCALFAAGLCTCLHPPCLYTSLRPPYFPKIFTSSLHPNAPPRPAAPLSAPTCNLQARQLLIDINRLGLPVACEYIDTISPQFIADLVSWSGNDASTVESPLHCELSSGLSTPVGFKNGNSGDSGAAIEAVSASAGPHAFLSVSKQGVAGIVETSGNRDCHVVLHGGTGGPNHSEEAVRGVCNSLAALQLPARVMVDCGSYNARQSPSVQAEVAESMAARIAKGDECVFGLVLHSFLVSGRQDVVAGGAPVYGMSVTEPCMDWSATSAILQKLAAAVRQRRAASQSAAVFFAASANGIERSLSFAELGEIDTDNLRIRMIRPLRPRSMYIHTAAMVAPGLAAAACPEGHRRLRVGGALHAPTSGGAERAGLPEVGMRRHGRDSKSAPLGVSPAGHRPASSRSSSLTWPCGSRSCRRAATSRACSTAAWTSSSLWSAPPRCTTRARRWSSPRASAPRRKRARRCARHSRGHPLRAQ